MFHGPHPSIRSAALLLLTSLGAAGGCRTQPRLSRAVDSTFTWSGRPVPAAAINGYLVRHLGFGSRGGRMVCAYVPLGQQGNRVFISTLCRELVVAGHSMSWGSGRAGPVAIELALRGDSILPVSHRVPEDGGRYASTVREIFPRDAAAAALATSAADTLERHLDAVVAKGPSSLPPPSD